MKSSLPSLIVLLPLVVAGIALYSGLHQFFLYLRNRQYPEEKYYTGATIFVAFYNVAAALNYAARSPEECMYWQLWQLSIVNGVIFFLLQFCHDYFRFHNRFFRAANFLLWPIAVVTAFGPPYGLSLDTPAYKNVFGLEIYESDIGPLILGFNVYIFVLVFWMFGLILRQWWRTRERDALIFSAGFSLIVLITANDVFTLLGLYLAEYGFFALAMVMAAVLSDRYERLRAEVQDLNVNLEKKVQIRTRELSDSLREVRSLKVQQDGDYYLTTLLLRPLMLNTVRSDTVTVEFLVRQKKQFEFSEKELEIGGDMCIAHSILLKGRRFTAFINGDAMGKSIQGAGGALVLGVVFNSLVERTRAAAYQDKFPEQWLRDCYVELENIYYSFDGSMLISVFFGLVEDATGATYFANAEHPRTVLLRDGRAAFVEEDSQLMKIGLAGVNPDFQVQFVQLQPGDALFAGSDGRDDMVVGLDEEEQRIINTDDNLFLTYVEESGGDLEEILRALERSGEFSDDLSVLKIRYRPGGAAAAPKDPGGSAEFERVFREANDYYRKERFAEAAPLFETACRLDPGATVAARRLARSYLKLKQYRDMAALCRQRMDRFPAEIEFAYLAAHALKMERKLKDAADYGERYFLRDADFVPNCVNLAEIYQLSGVYDRALVLLRRVLAAEPEHKKALKIKSIIDIAREIGDDSEV